MGFIEFLKAALIGVIQGITEWLPISSTGHMILADEFIRLGMTDEFKEMFFVVVQLGSILAVVVLYFHRLNPFSPRKSLKEKKSTMSLWAKVLIGAVPAGIVGVLFNDILDALFYKPVPIAAALIIYGVLFILLENRNKKRKPKYTSLEQMSYMTALEIGLFQMLALIPGTSRSGSTILGAIIVGTARPVAAEFSFFLAIPMMLGASAIKLLKFGVQFTGAEWGVLVTGTLVAFAVSVAAIKFLVGYVRKHDFKAFGYYRIVLGAAVLLYFLFIAR